MLVQESPIGWDQEDDACPPCTPKKSDMMLCTCDLEGGGATLLCAHVRVHRKSKRCAEEENQWLWMINKIKIKIKGFSITLER